MRLILVINCVTVDLLQSRHLKNVTTSTLRIVVTEMPVFGDTSTTGGHAESLPGTIASRVQSHTNVVECTTPTGQIVTTLTIK